jgi:GntR family transcriptional regulator, arabinose operon transcriptional repressor
MPGGKTTQKSATPFSGFKADESRRKFRHREVFDALMGEITSGRLQPGDRMPTEAELSKTFSASRTTVSRAMRDLKQQGLLDRQRGGGTKVASRASKRIVLFTPFAQNAAGLGFMGANVYAHLADLASSRGDHLSLQLIGRVDDDPLKNMLAAADAITRDTVDGVFYYPVELPPERAHYNQQVVDKLIAAGLTVVLVDRDIATYPQRSDRTLIMYDNNRGGYLLSDHIIKQGRRRIAYVGIPNVSSAAADRLRGYCDALDANGLPIDRNMIRRAGLTEITPEFWQSLMDDLKPDAIVCNSDRYAASAGRHLDRMGLHTGQDVLLGGFGDQPFAEMLAEPLTTVRFPLDPFSTACYDELLAQVGGKIVPGRRRIIVDVQLVVRASTGVAAAAAV